MSWFVCTIGSGSPRNWEICKEIGAYGIPGRGTARRPAARNDDRLLVWIGGKGFAAVARVIGDPKVLANRTEAPWPGGLQRWAYVLPLEVEVEVVNPLKLPFVGNRQPSTGITKSMLFRSFSRIEDAGADEVRRALVARAAEEAQPAQ